MIPLRAFFLSPLRTGNLRMRYYDPLYYRFLISAATQFCYICDHARIFRRRRQRGRDNKLQIDTEKNTAPRSCGLDARWNGSKREVTLLLYPF